MNKDLLYSMDRGAWQATVYRVAKIRTLYSTGNYIQHLAINHNGKEYEKECVNHFAEIHNRNTAEIIHCKSTIFQ